MMVIIVLGLFLKWFLWLLLLLSLWLFWLIGLRVIHLTESRWPNEFDRIMAMTNIKNWTWPKLAMTNLLKPTNLNYRLGSSMPDVFFSCRRAKGKGKRGWAGVPASASLWACELGEPVQADRTSIFLGGKVNVFLCHVNVCLCHEFRSSSKIFVKNFWSHSFQFLVILIQSSELAS